MGLESSYSNKAMSTINLLGELTRLSDWTEISLSRLPKSIWDVSCSTTLLNLSCVGLTFLCVILFCIVFPLEIVLLVKIIHETILIAFGMPYSCTADSSKYIFDCSIFALGYHENFLWLNNGWIKTKLWVVLHIG